MIVLDTNVISALMRPVENPNVVEWLDRQEATDVWTTSVSIYEIRFGLLRLNAGRRRTDLTTLFETFIDKLLPGKVLPFDRQAAEIAATDSVVLRARGRTISIPDAQIGAIARSQGATLATRNVKDFEDLDISLINPWKN